MEEKTIEELEAEVKRLEENAQESYRAASKLKMEIAARTKDETQQYFHKFIKYYTRTYCNYLYVTGAESDYEGGWRLTGHGFTTYERTEEDNYRQFQTMHLSCCGVNLSDIKSGYYTLELITREEFYDIRNKCLQDVMNESYD